MNSADDIVIPEIWGGMECTVNRVNDEFHDQFEMAGYADHPEYLDAILGLGLKTIRYPVLWEKHVQLPGAKDCWEQTTYDLQKLKMRGVEPIAGLLHHGSGPYFTDLEDVNFPGQLAAYALEVATRFPWLQFFTPLNEPLTTARFSGLYGYWYPHKKADKSFIKILLNQLKGIVLAMAAIRTVIPGAKLVQTEDLAKTYSTDLLQYQAVFENHRRWLTYDILIGNFDNRHPLWNYFIDNGATVSELEFFLRNPCIPEVMGFNYYLTSERFLDEETVNFPDTFKGGNGIHDYADLEMVRVNHEACSGLEVLLTEAWNRYGLPLAITEVHLNCTREEQLRWLMETHTIAVRLNRQGILIKAITAWALLGSFGWDKLLTGPVFNYESGAFDISCNVARPTALAFLIEAFIKKDFSGNQLTPAPGWWMRNDRFYNGGDGSEEKRLVNNSRPVVIIGNTGTLGNAFARICRSRHITCKLTGRNEADVTNPAMLRKMIKRYQPWAIINASGYVDVDKAETEPGLCKKINADAAKNLALLCEELNIRLVCFSTDLVFDGKKKTPYHEGDLACPVNAYGHSKLIGEYFLSVYNPSALTIRTSAFFGPWDNYNFITRTIEALQQNRQVNAFDDVEVSPTYIPHLVNATLDLLIDHTSGVVHLAGKGSITWYELAKMVAVTSSLDETLVQPVSGRNMTACRPPFSALTSNIVSMMPGFEQGLREYFNHRGVLMHN